MSPKFFPLKLLSYLGSSTYYVVLFTSGEIEVLRVSVPKYFTPVLRAGEKYFPPKNQAASRAKSAL